MMHSDHHTDQDSNSNNSENWLFSRTGLATVGALGVLGFLVYTGHSAHLLGFAPYLLIFSCPLMHIFMHRGHHGQNSGSRGKQHSHGGGCCGGGRDNDKTTEPKSQGER